MLFNPYYLLFLPANSGVDNHTWASAFSQQEINGGNQPSSRGGKSQAPGASSPGFLDQNKTAENKGVWEFRKLRQDPGSPAASVQAEAAWTSRELVEF